VYKLYLRAISSIG